MHSVGIREARSDLATIVRRASTGQRTIITVTGRAVAQIGPVEVDGGASGTTLADLIARGLLDPPRRTGEPRPSVPVPMWSATRLDRLLSEIRGR